MNIRQRMIPPLYLLLSLLVMALLRWVLPGPQLFPILVRWLAGLIFLCGLGLGLWAVRQFNRAGTSFHPHAQSKHLVTAGLYQYTRNPMYLGMALLLVATAILLGRLLPFLVIPAFMWIIQTDFIRKEEARLTANFGAEYTQYQTRVRRWL